MRSSAADLAGVRAAFVAPDWIEEDRLGSLTAWSDDAASAPRAPVAQTEALDETSGRARRAAWLTLRLLARLRPDRWRTTCLYRSVAECLALRALAIPCRVELSAGRHPTTGQIEAHAVVRVGGAGGVDASDRAGDAATAARIPFRPAGVSVRRTG